MSILGLLAHGLGAGKKMVWDDGEGENGGFVGNVNECGRKKVRFAGVEPWSRCSARGGELEARTILTRSFQKNFQQRPSSNLEAEYIKFLVNFLPGFRIKQFQHTNRPGQVEFTSTQGHKGETRSSINQHELHTSYQGSESRTSSRHRITESQAHHDLRHHDNHATLRRRSCLRYSAPGHPPSHLHLHHIHIHNHEQRIFVLDLPIFSAPQAATRFEPTETIFYILPPCTKTTIDDHPFDTPIDLEFRPRSRCRRCEARRGPRHCRRRHKIQRGHASLGLEHLLPAPQVSPDVAGGWLGHHVAGKRRGWCCCLDLRGPR